MPVKLSQLNIGKLLPTLTASLLLILTLSMVSATPNSPLPSKPIIIGPANGTVVHTYSPLLQWNVANATTYKVVIKNAAGTVVLSAKVTEETACNVEQVCYLSPVEQGIQLLNGKFTWRVTAKDADGGAKSAVSSFTVDFPGAPDLLTPADGATVAGNPYLEWTVVDDGFQYKVKLKNIITGEKVATDWAEAGVICVETCFYNSILTTGSYKWSVLARYDDPAYVSKSAKRTFTISES